MVFMVDSGAKHPMVTKPMAPLTETGPQQSESLTLKPPGSSADPGHAN
jgi:hypothetical protein